MMDTITFTRKIQRDNGISLGREVGAIATCAPYANPLTHDAVTLNGLFLVVFFNCNGEIRELRQDRARSIVSCHVMSCLLVSVMMR